MPTWTLKAKIPLTSQEDKILTPDGYEILVGADEDQVLIYEAELSLWLLKSEISALWLQQQKQLFYTYLVLQDGNYFGLQDDSILYVNSDTTESWQHKQKV